MSAGRRAGQRYDAEHGVATEALIFLGELDPDAIGPSLAFATHYEPTPLADLERLLDALPLPPERTTFIDLGSGMGRAVLSAAARPYRQVIGVEFSPALHAIAKDNRASYRGELRCHDIRLVCADAGGFSFPRGDLAVYLYNPFSAEILAPILARLAADASREVTVAYHTPLERDVLDEHPAFELTTDLGFGLIYRFRREV
jgi:SAM-dependent methyltransferase